MSNIAPQKPQLNRRLWAKIEKFTRIQAIKYKKISVITGSCGSLGTLGRKRHNVNIPKW
jgi:endonuclease G